jgi:hypothetical protein
MSKSNLPAENIAGSLPVPSSPDPAASEIAAELSDHLATATERLQQQGLPASAAHEQAQAQFGDLAAISRRCYWIKQGDTLMFRSAIIALLSILCLALAVTTLGSWRSQSRMSEQMAALTAQLKALAESQTAVPLASQPVPFEIRGQVYLASPEKPAANAEVMVCRAGDGEIVRRLVTDKAGAYASGPLPEGDYTVVVKESSQSTRTRWGLQSEPVYLYAGVPSPKVDLDLAPSRGRLTIELQKPLPRLEVEGQYTIDSRLVLQVWPKFHRTLRWTTQHAVPDRWPLCITYPEGDPLEKNQFPVSFRAVVGNGELVGRAAINFPGIGEELATGPCHVTAAIVADIKPWGMGEDVLTPIGQPRTLRWMSADWVTSSYMGGLWHAKLRAGRQGPMHLNPNFFGLSSAIPVELVARDLTCLTVEFPDDVVSRLQNLVETTSDADKFEKSAKTGQIFIREAQVTVVDSKAKVSPPGASLGED